MEHLGTAVKIQREILVNSENEGGVLRNLPRLLDALSREKESASFMYTIRQKMEARNAEVENKKIQTLNWITRCFQKLSQSGWVSHPNIQKKYLDAKSTILDKILLPMEELNFGKGHIEASFDHLAKLAHIVAAFGEIALFDGWAYIVHTQISYGPSFHRFWNGYKLVNEEKSLIDIEDVEHIPRESSYRLQMTAAEQNKFSILLGNGVTDWVINPVTSTVETAGKCKEIQIGQTINIGKMYIKDFIYPKCAEGILCRRYNENVNQKEMLWSDPIELFSYLLFLSEYGNCEPATIPPKDPILNWDDVENYNFKTNIGIYLSKFTSADKNKRPYQKEDLIRLVDSFLMMVSVHISEKKFLKGPQKTSFYSAKAEEFAVKELKEHIRGMSEEERSSFKEPKKLSFVLKRADELFLDEDVKKAISPTLVNVTASTRAKIELKKEEIDWEISLGRPKKKHKTPVQATSK